MKCQADIIKLATEKLTDAECLLANGRVDGAFYMAGYYIELLLKARVCKTLGIDDFFDFDNPAKKKIKADSNLYRPFKVHDFEQLLVLSGIYKEFEVQLNDIPFKTHWSIVKRWNESSRYSIGHSTKEVKDFITSSKEFASWIQKHL